ncbi:MAG: tRNA 2-thiouridine(34) synthase MnmA [Fimbriimonadales bacterium]
MKRKPRVMVAMSGGVDSSVVAGILVRRGYDVIGVTMQIWQESQTDPRHAGCCSLGAVEDARGVARRLDIPYYVINFKKEFKDRVITRFMDEYERGRTPNPCIECNRHVKFDALLQKAREVGCNMLATGHYARVRRDSKTGLIRLLRARAKNKDQSYALYSLSQDQLSQAKFPLGELSSKAETREIARDLGLTLADKPDSQEICFVGEAGGYVEFMKKNRPAAFSDGDIINEEGKPVGKHGGVGLYTVGQRRRIGPNIDGKPLFVLRLDPSANRVVVGDNEALMKRSVAFDDQLGHLSKPTKVVGRIRYNMKPASAVLYPGEPFRAEFVEPVRAVTPGQAAVFYRGETVVAGGPIR